MASTLTQTIVEFENVGGEIELTEAYEGQVPPVVIEVSVAPSDWDGMPVGLDRYEYFQDAELRDSLILIFGDVRGREVFDSSREIIALRHHMREDPRI